jgi:hypothetical protein
VICESGSHGSQWRAYGRSPAKAIAAVLVQADEHISRLQALAEGLPA